MSQIVAVAGPSGSGKSTSTSTLPPDKTAFINVVGKSLPFKGWKKHYNKQNKNYLIEHNYAKIINYIKWFSDERPEIKYLIVDDAQYVLATEFVDRALEKGYDKWSEMAQHLFKMVSPTLHSKLREDLTIFFLFHTESASEGSKEKIKTSGKLIDQHVTLEGLFTIVLFAEVLPPESSDGRAQYFFRTQTDGKKTAKSPAGMFDDVLIPNDLGLVVTRMEKYYEGE